MIYSDPKYKGKHVIIIKDKIFSARTGEEMVKKFEDVVKKYPDFQPTLTYIPKEDSLILLHYGY